MRTGRVTLGQLARELELDKSSISLALRGSPRISAATRERVVAAARRLGYRVNSAAQQLATGRSHTLGIVLPATFATLRAEVAIRTIERLAALVAADGKTFAILSATDIGRATNGAWDLPVPEALFVWGDVPQGVVAAAGLRDTPAVVLDPSHLSYAGYEGLGVTVDNLGVGRLMVEHMVARGVRRLLFVQAKSNHLGHLRRWDGARQAWQEHRPLPELTFAQFEEVTDALLASYAGGGGGILCATDYVAVVLLRRLLHAGFRLPADLRLAGINGEEPARLMEVTTARFDSAGLAEAGYRMLRQAQQGEPVTPPPALPFTLEPGGTT